MKHCVVIDDSDVIRKVAKRILEDLNITSTEAETADEGLAMCKKAMPDAVLLDWHLPRMLPTDFLQLLRQLDGGEAPVVFYCTTENDPELITKALDLGADDYILKPYDKESIQQKLHAAGLL
jgi:two-component system chemotaxis response regulator CheY